MTIKIGRARLKNKSRLPTEELVELTRFVLTFLECKKKIKIKVLNSRIDSGEALGRKVKVRLPKNRWPRSGNTGRHRNFPHYLLRDWKEGYVAVLTHEVVHATGASGKRNGEWLCEITACAALLTYRNLQQ